MRTSVLMSRAPQTCRPSDTLAAAAREMWNHDCGFLPVVDERDRVVGVLTDRDICMAAYLQGRPLDRILVADVMTRDVHTVDPADDATRALALMREMRVRRLPVVDREGRVLGVLSLDDLARAADERMSVLVTAALARVCEARTVVEEQEAG